MSAVFWGSALLGDLILTSREEKKLDNSLRIGSAFYFVTFTFAAIWQFFSIRNSWKVGIFLLIGFLIQSHGFHIFDHLWHQVKRNFFKNFKIYLIYLATSLLFFAPLILGNTFGPFTEGGGDVSIYSDVAHLLARKNKTAYGRNGSIRDLNNNVIEIFRIAFDSAAEQDYIDHRFEEAEEASLNVALAESSANRIIVSQTMSNYIYVPYAAFDFLSIDTNYNVFYGILAFLYALMVVSVYSLFRNRGRLVSAIAVALVLSSHGIISVFYNLYAAQAFSMAFSALLLAMLLSIPVFSLAGLRNYGPGIVCLWVMYPHFLTIVLPLVIILGLFSNKFKMLYTNPCC